MMNAIETKPDMTLAEIAEILESEHLASFARSIWRILDRHSATFKKARTRPSRIGRLSRRRVRLGANWPRQIPTSRSSSKRPVPRPK